jgi:hypothetical protein
MKTNSQIEIAELTAKIENLENTITSERLENAEKITMFSNDLLESFQSVVNMTYSLNNTNLSIDQMTRLERGNKGVESLVEKIRSFRDPYEQIAIAAKAIGPFPCGQSSKSAM